MTAKIQTVVQPGHKIEVEVPDLQIGTVVNVSVSPFTEPNRTSRSAEQWVAEWRAWIASHAPVTHFVDDSREAIYEGRGE
jgi:hypothetical protein